MSNTTYIIKDAGVEILRTRNSSDIVPYLPLQEGGGRTIELEVEPPTLQPLMVLEGITTSGVQITDPLGLELPAPSGAGFAPVIIEEGEVAVITPVKKHGSPKRPKEDTDAEVADKKAKLAGVKSVLSTPMPKAPPGTLKAKEVEDAIRALEARVEANETLLRLMASGL